MKSVLFVIFTAIACHASPIISSSTFCTVSCTGTDTQATATVSGQQLFAAASYTGQGSSDWLSASAKASYDDDFVLTLHGGTGIGRFLPCLSILTSDAGYLAGSGASAEATFGSVNAALGQGNCSSAGPVLPLAFDTPAIFHLHLAVSAYADDSLPHSNGATARAALLGVQVEPGMTYTLIESSLGAFSVPEPGGFGYLLLGVVAIVLTRAGVPSFSSRPEPRSTRTSADASPSAPRPDQQRGIC